VRVEIEPRGLVEGKIRASIACEVTHAMPSDREDLVSAGGVCFRTSGLFTPGKMVRLSSPDSDTWIEVTLEMVEAKAKPARR
jgi:hypothetical protein